MSVEPFHISVSENDLHGLTRRLDEARLPRGIFFDQWDRGISGKVLVKALEYWQKSYNWRTVEEKLNKLNHYKAEISGIDIHFIHEKGKKTKSVPIILTHGWPDCFLRYTKIIPMLTDPEKFGIETEFSFDVVIPSLPGFGFSNYPEDHSLINNETISELWLELMTKRLGYQRFIAGGGDIGSGVTRYLAHKFPENLFGIHLTDVGIVRQLLDPSRSRNLSPSEQEYLQKANEWLNNESGYMKMQATKPQTLAFALSDSPIGLTAWILEKFYSWGDMQSSLTLDDVLTNISIFWFQNNAFTANRIYYENSHSLSQTGKITVPTGVCLFPKDILLPPREWIESNFNIVHWKKANQGGHFTAMEAPEAFAADLFSFLKKLDLA